MVSLTPERLLQHLNENTTYNIPPLLSPAPSKLLQHPTVIPGERILIQQDATSVDTFSNQIRGTIHLTTYRVIFSGTIIQDFDESISNNNNDIDNKAEDDATEVARKGYIFQRRFNRSYKMKAQATLGRLKQKAQDIQTGLQGAKTSITLKSPGRSKSKDLYCTIPEDEKLTSDEVPQDCCQLVSVEPLSYKTTNQDTVSHTIVLSIPCTSIYDVRKLSKNSLTKGAKLVLLADGIELLCSTLQTYKFCLPVSSTCDADKLVEIFSKYTKNLFQPCYSGSVMRKQQSPANIKSPSKWFAIAYHKSIMLPPKYAEILYSKDYPNFYNFKTEFNRLGLLETNNWNIICPKQPYVDTYPVKTLVPFSVSESELFDIIKFHGAKSYPSICWRNQEKKTIMLRSGATLHRRGMVETRCEADENYLAFICRQNELSTDCKLIVFTEQNRTAATPLRSTSQQISGQISAKQGEAFYYPYVRFVYTDKNIKYTDHNSVRENSRKLQTLLSSNSCDDKSFYSALGETQWLSQISELLETASLIVTALTTHKLSVLISYEEGRDRTSQLSSLAQVLLDPYYRTIDGFQVLIQKEWLSFGHMFAERCVSHKSTDTHGPFFLQWMDCIWQVTKQFPLSFEFNEDFLQMIIDNVYSCRFGTFLCNNERQHIEEEIDSKTLSLWTWINLTLMAEQEKFTNHYYQCKNENRVLMPLFHIPSLKVWESYYAKTKIEDNLKDAWRYSQEQSRLLEELYKGDSSRYKRLKEKQSAYQSDTSSESSSEVSSSINDEKSEEKWSIDDKTGSLEMQRSVQYTGTLRNLESKSLDSLLDKRRPQTQSKSKKLLGSKFYVNQPKTKEVFENAMVGQKESKSEGKNHVTRKSQMFDDLCHYLISKDFNWDSETDINITEFACCGFLTKLGYIRQNWLRRWFTLDLRKNCLAYFEKQEDDVPKGVIKCDKILEVYGDIEKKNKNKFFVRTQERTFEFKAPNKNLMDIWITILTMPHGTVCVR